MQVYFLKETENNSIFKKILKPIKIENDKITINYDLDKVSFKKKIKIATQIRRFLHLNKSKKIILSSKIKKDEEFVNLLYGNGIEIINSKYLFRLVTKDIINEILKKNNINQEEVEISIAVNYKDDIIIRLIEDLASKFKSVHIVTNSIPEFAKMSEKLYQEIGAIVTVTNNKKKALFRSDIIINVDFPKELINKYSIKDTGIIVNLDEKVKINKKRFCGKIINDFNINLNPDSEIANAIQKDEYKDFDLKDLVECYLLNNMDEIKNVKISIN